MNLDDILSKDTLMGDTEALRNFVANNFEDLESIVILWETKEGQIYHRAYGESSYLIGLLEKAKYILLRRSIGETKDKDEEE